MEPARGRFGPFGGRYVSETLIPALDELAEAWRVAQADPAFASELDGLLRDYVGRPSLLTFAERLGRAVDGGRGARIWLKREDLNHTGSHKINNCVGQALLARRMGKRRLIAETGAGQHGVATATVAVATPCWPAPVSAITRGLPMRRASSACPMQLLILCEPVWLSSSRFSQILAP